MVIKKLLIFILFVLLFSLQIFAQGAWHPEKNYFPRTIIDSSQAEISAVRDKISSPPFDSIYDDVLTYSEIGYSTVNTQRQKARIARCAAFRYLIENDGTNYADKAKSYLMITEREDYANIEEQYRNILWDSETLSMNCITYDLLKGMDYNFEGDEDQIRTQIKNIASSLYDDLVVEDPWDPLYLMWVNGLGEQINYGVKLSSALGMAAIILNTETGSQAKDQPQAWINYAMTTLNKEIQQAPAKDGWLVGVDGGWAEGPHYISFSGSSFIPFAISHDNFLNGQSEEYDGLELEPLIMWENIAKSAEWGVKIRQPDGARPDFDDAYLDTYYFNGILAPYLDNTNLAWDYENSSEPFYSENQSNNMSVEVISTLDSDYFGSPPPDIPYSRFLPHAGQTIFRSDWSEDAVYMCLLGENGIAREGGHTHEHPDNTSFIIHAYGELLAMDSGYISWDERDKVRYADNHSLILVDGEGPPAAGSIYSNGTDAFLHNYFDTEQYDYCEVNTNYQDTDFERCVSFVDNSFFIITDFVDGNSSHDYDWLLHGNGGGDTGNGFELQTYGSQYIVNDVNLHFFLSSSSTMDFSNYEDYHDDGNYDIPATHTVTKGSINSDDAVFSAILYPALDSESVTYNPTTSNDYTGGLLETDDKKVLAASKNNNISINTNFNGYELNFDSEILTFYTKIDSYIPSSVFMRMGQNIEYDEINFISTNELTNLNLNIFNNYADGFVQNGCEIAFYTGNAPTAITGANSWEFESGVTTAVFNDSTYFQIEVEWSLEEYGVSEPPANYIIRNFLISPNPIYNTDKKINVSFQLEKKSQVEICVYNILGQKIQAFLGSELTAGKYDFKFSLTKNNEAAFSSGIYFFKLSTEKSNYIRKALIF